MQIIIDVFQNLWEKFLKNVYKKAEVFGNFDMLKFLELRQQLKIHSKRVLREIISEPKYLITKQYCAIIDETDDNLIKLLEDIKKDSNHSIFLSEKIKDAFFCLGNIYLIDSRLNKYYKIILNFFLKAWNKEILNLNIYTFINDGTKNTMIRHNNTRNTSALNNIIVLMMYLQFEKGVDVLEFLKIYPEFLAYFKHTTPFIKETETYNTGSPLYKTTTNELMTYILSIYTENQFIFHEFTTPNGIFLINQRLILDLLHIKSQSDLNKYSSDVIRLSGSNSLKHFLMGRYFHYLGESNKYTNKTTNSGVFNIAESELKITDKLDNFQEHAYKMAILHYLKALQLEPNCECVREKLNVLLKFGKDFIKNKLIQLTDEIKKKLLQNPHFLDYQIIYKDANGNKILEAEIDNTIQINCQANHVVINVELPINYKSDLFRGALNLYFAL